LDGAKIFRNYCAACQGVNGSGDGPVAPALKTKPPELSIIARRNGGTFPTARVRRFIAGDEVLAAHGSREMPVWGPIFHEMEYDQNLGYVRLQDVTDYLNSIQRKQNPRAGFRRSFKYVDLRRFSKGAPFTIGFSP
jgi:mono/diheme cytochrome c family protein